MGAAGNIACYSPVQAERANVVIELYIKLIIQQIVILSGAQRNLTIFSYINVPHTQVILMSKITIVYGHMIRTFEV